MNDKSLPNIKDIIADLLNTLDKVKFKELLKNNLEEFNELEFKENYLSYDKLAKHILAMANTGNGIIIFGVKDNNGNLKPKGIDLRDKTKIKENLSNYLPKTLEYEIFDFKYDNNTEWKEITNKNFQMIAVYFTPERIPFLPKKEDENVKPFEIYCRKNNSSTKAMYEDLETIFNLRINSAHNKNNFDLKKELEDLRTLMSYNTLYYQLDFRNSKFLSTVNTLKEKKKKLIERELRIDDIEIDE